jgi:tol-pal system protein YbgF
MLIKKIKKTSCSFVCLAFFLSPLIILASCASSDDVGKVQWQLNEIRSDVRDLEARLPSEEGQGKAVSDLFIKTQAISKDIQRLTGQIEEMQYYSEQKSGESVKSEELFGEDIKEMKAVQKSLDKRLAGIEEAVALIEVKIEELSKGTGRELKEPRKPEAKNAYMAAYETYKAGKITEARDQFGSLIKDYPESDYSDNARFWIAESYYKEKKYEDAILAYEELFKMHPDSEKIPGAMLKQGLAFYELKDKKTGNLILESLLEKFPDSEQARIAKRKLKETGSSDKK